LLVTGGLVEKAMTVQDSATKIINVKRIAGRIRFFITRQKYIMWGGQRVGPLFCSIIAPLLAGSR
jgi:hypothetical protein